MTTAAFHIDPNGIYDDALLYRTMEINKTTLARARRTGKLRFTRKGTRTLYLGRWILEWLTADDDCEKRSAPIAQ